MTKNEKVLARVQKLLALANGDANENESQSAMLQAQRLLATNNLSMDDVTINDKVDKEVQEMDGTEWTRIPWWQKELSHTVAENFRCYVFMKSWKGKRKMVFLGTKEDTEVAVEVYKFAIEDIKYQARQYLRKRNIKGTRAMSNAVKNDYIGGYLQGLKAKFQEQVNKEGWGLVLVKDDAVVKKFEDMDMSSERSRSRSTVNDNDAHNKGYKDGKNFDNGRQRLTQ